MDKKTIHAASIHLIKRLWILQATCNSTEKGIEFASALYGATILNLLLGFALSTF